MGEETGHYWDVDVPGLTRDEAARLARWVRDELGREATVLDPAKYLTWHLGRNGAETLAAALRETTQSTAHEPMLAELTEWLGDQGPN
jgi:uncharacterized Fe-S cluster-containing radical SAM superfamily enzyme